MSDTAFGPGEHAPGRKEVTDLLHQPLTRRRLLQASAGGALGVGLAGLLAACGSSAASSPIVTSGASPVPGGSGATPSPRKGGTLRVGASGGAASDTLDAQNLILNTDFCRGAQLYDRLVRYDDKTGKSNLDMADSITPNSDATEWTIVVKKGVVTHDGKPFGAADVLFSLQRIVKNNFPGATSVGPVDFNNSKIVDQQTLLLKYQKPYSILLDVLGHYYYYMVPVGYDPKNPIGTGPFKLQSFTPNVASTVVRNENYWQSGVPFLDSIVTTNLSDETAQINALQAGQVDAIDFLSAPSVAALQGTGAQVIVSKSAGWGPFTMRVDQAPFSDVRVRQALRLLVDRKQMLDSVFAGYGSLGNDVIWLHTADYANLPQRELDINQAQSLLKAAGYADLSVDMITSDFAPGMVQAAQVYATQAKAAGVNVNIKKQTQTEYFANSYLKVPFSQDYWGFEPYLVAASQALIHGAPFNATWFNDTQYNALFDHATSTTDESARNDAIAQMVQIEYDRGGYIIPYFFPIIDGVGANVRGVEPTISGLALGNFNFRAIWMAQ